LKLPPHVYHLAEAVNWPLIQRDGLLSASRLLAAAKLTKPERHTLGRMQRTNHTRLVSGAEIRDQRPMPEAALKSCLVGMEPTEWYALLNSKVFFWLDVDRLNRQHKACGSRPQVVLTVDLTKLLEAHQDQAFFSPINTGYARRKPAIRGQATFVPYATWLESGWASEAKALGTTPRSRSHEPVEVTIRDAVPDVMEYVISITELAEGEELQV
jgi:hypothetical protein